MKKSSGINLKVLTGLILVLLLTMTSSVYSQTIRLNYANFPPASTFPCIQMERWKEEVERRTEGEVSISTFPGGTLLGAKNMMDGVIAGQADIGCLSMAYQPGRFMLTNATSLPLGFPNARVASRVLWDLHEKYQPDEFSQVKVLTMFACAPSNIMSKKPVKSIDDLNGMSLRASGNATQALRIWGANPVGMPMSETPEALQKGVVQGLFSSLEVMKDFNYAEQCRFVTLTETVIYPFAVVMNRNSWEKLPDGVKKVMDDLSVEQSEWTGVYMDNHVKESLRWSKEKYDIEIIRLPEEKLESMNAMLSPIVEEWIQDAKAKNLPAEEIIEYMKKIAEKYSNE